MTAAPLPITVLTPSRDYRRFLADTVNSVAAQSYPAVDHVVQDGASTDGSDRLLAGLAARHPRLSYRSAPDAGQSDALNRALAASGSRWLGWLNADEFYLPGAVAAAAEAITADPAADVVYGDCVFVDAEGRFLRLLPAHRFCPVTLRHYGCFIPSCATFVRRDALPATGWDTRMRRMMDWHLWLTLAARGARFRYVPRPLAAFRVHDAQVTGRPLALDAEEFALVRRLHRLPGRPDAEWAPRPLGRAVHLLRKARDGGFARQARAARLAHGGDLRWWLADEARERAARLVAL